MTASTEAVSFSDKLPAYIRITDISEHGHFLSRPARFCQAPGADQFSPPRGRDCLRKNRASVGKSYLYDSRDRQLVFAWVSDSSRPNPELLVPAFLAAYATTKPYWNWVRLMSMRSGQPGINGNEYAQLPLFVPPLPEQTAIAEVLTEMDAELAALEQRRDKTRALKQGMMQELLTGRSVSYERKPARRMEGVLAGRVPEVDLRLRQRRGRGAASSAGTTRAWSVGVPNAAQLLEDMPNKVRDILGIMVEVNLKQRAGKDYLEIVVEPYPYPVSYKGEYHSAAAAPSRS